MIRMKVKKLVGRDVVKIQENKITKVMSMTIPRSIREKQEFTAKNGDNVTIDLFDDGTWCVSPVPNGIIMNGGAPNGS